MNQSDRDSSDACARLADHLQAHKDPLMKEWLAKARGDSAVLSDLLSNVELVDHVPRIFDAMLLELRSRCGGAKRDVQDITARHTVIRWVQHYDLRAVLREVSLLRAAFIRQLLVFDAENPDLGNEARLLNAMTIHRILDDIVNDATDTFLRLEGRAGQGEA